MNILSLIKHAVGFLLLLMVSFNLMAKTILIHGDSLSAGYGLAEGEEWPFLLGQKLADSGFSSYTVVNSSISGETTQGGLARLPGLIEQYNPDIIILELGANDGLRGQSLKAMYQNLAQMVTLARDNNASIVLTGIHITPNLGKRYTDAFYKVFTRLQNDYQLPFVPFLLEGIATDAALMQQDGLHPTAQAQPLIVDTVWPVLKPLLHLEE